MNSIKQYIKKENIIPLILSLGFGLVFFFDSTYFNNQGLKIVWIFAVILIVILITFYFVWAGMTVLKSLFLLGAELSLLIFLAQSYCGATPLVSTQGDPALRSFILLGMVFIMFGFSKSLYKAVHEKFFSDKKEGWGSGKKLGVGLFFVSIVAFLWMLYEVIGPSISTICVFNR